MKTKKLLLFAVCLIFGLNIKAQNNYHRITDLSEIQNGSAVIIAARHDSLSATSYYAMSNVAAGKPQGVLFSSISTGVDICLPTEITDNEMNFCWTVGITEGWSELPGRQTPRRGEQDGRVGRCSGSR